MKVLGIAGSPNANGNTVYAVKYALTILAEQGFETRFISLADKSIDPCTGCWHCRDHGVCVFDDDMTAIYEALRWCDGLIIGSPVYLGMVSGQTKVMMDRSVALRANRDDPFALAGKTGGGIACGGFRNGGQELTLQNIQTFLLQHNMRAISDGSPYA
ncbi:MAG: flavodoxin family protein, partial [Anaerolineae bacterium]|nr:flavodoxin family protein [Anaerolineae bacterium]